LRTGEKPVFQINDREAIKVGGASLSTAVVFFCAAKWLPPVDANSYYSKAVAAGYSNALLPLVGVLLVGGLAVGLLLGKGAGDLPRGIAEIAKPVAYWRWHLLAACLISVLQVSLFPVWSEEANFFGVRVALMANHKLPYVDFEYPYGYLVAYLPYWLHALGLSIARALTVTLALAAVAGVLSIGVLLQSAIAKPAMRLTLFWTLAAVGVLVEPGPSLNYNLGRYASPFALLLLLVRFAPRLPAVGMFGAAACAQTLVYFVSPEMGAAFSVSTLAWLALSVRALPNAKLIAAGAGLLASGAGLAVFCQPMFWTLFVYSQAQILMPIVPNVIMLLYVVCFPILAGVALWTAITIWKSDEIADARPRIGACACAALAVALAPAVIGRSWPTITVAYGLATIVMTAGLLAASDRPSAAWVVASMFAIFVAYSSILGGVTRDWAPVLRRVLHRHAAPDPNRAAAQIAKGNMADTGRWLAQTFPNAYDPLDLIGARQPSMVDLGFYIGMDDLATNNAFDRKREDFQRAKYYIIPTDKAAAMESPDQSLNGFTRAGLFPFYLSVAPSTAPMAKEQFLDALFSQCQPIASHGTVTVCARQAAP